MIIWAPEASNGQGQIYLLVTIGQTHPWAILGDKLVSVVPQIPVGPGPMATMPVGKSGPASGCG